MVRIASGGAKRNTSVADTTGGVELPERIDVVEHVERSAHRRDHEIGFFDPDIGDLHVRQIERQRMPRPAVVVRVVDAVLGAGIEHVAAFRILANRVRVVVRLQAVHDLRPRLAEIVRAEEIRRVVAQQRLLHCRVRGTCREHGRVDDAHAAQVGHLFRRHVRPRLAAVLRHLNLAVVRFRPR